jgi:hypothetical protein
MLLDEIKCHIIHQEPTFQCTFLLKWKIRFIHSDERMEEITAGAGEKISCHPNSCQQNDNSPEKEAGVMTCNVLSLMLYVDVHVKKRIGDR